MRKKWDNRLRARSLGSQLAGSIQQRINGGNGAQMNEEEVRGPHAVAEREER